MVLKCRVAPTSPESYLCPVITQRSDHAASCRHAKTRPTLCFSLPSSCHCCHAICYNRQLAMPYLLPFPGYLFLPFCFFQSTCWFCVLLSTHLFEHGLILHNDTHPIPLGGGFYLFCCSFKVQGYLSLYQTSPKPYYPSSVLWKALTPILPSCCHIQSMHV